MSAQIQNADSQRRAYEDVSVSGVVVAADDHSSTARELVAARAKETIYIQRIAMGVTTDHAATQTFQDTEGTPRLAATSKASPGLGALQWDFGDEGFALTEGAGLELVNSAAGLAYSFTVEAYRRRTAHGVP
jgi:hypothetical protein